MLNAAKLLMYRKEVGRNIRRLRLERGLTQAQLAEALDCSPDKISQYERGKKHPDMIFVYTIAQYFGVSLDEILPSEGGLYHHDSREAS